MKTNTVVYLDVEKVSRFNPKEQISLVGLATMEDPENMFQYYYLQHQLYHMENVEVSWDGRKHKPDVSDILSGLVKANMIEKISPDNMFSQIVLTEKGKENMILENEQV